tara:strand:- start:156 stop:518 length:363 start_codon:yes stop_codon:yes gene_type:complete
MKYHRVYTLQNGETRSELLPYDLKISDFIKGTPSFPMADMGAAKTLKVASIPSGWDGGWHPTPLKQWCITLSGSATIETSDKTIIELKGGVAVLLDDTFGKGHRTTVVGDDDWCGMLVAV